MDLQEGFRVVVGTYIDTITELGSRSVHDPARGNTLLLFFLRIFDQADYKSIRKRHHALLHGKRYAPPYRGRG